MTDESKAFWETPREVSHHEANEAAIRLINSHFKNDAERARISIPANPERDDDLIILSYIRQQTRLSQAGAGGGVVVTGEMVNAAWNEGKRRRVTGSTYDFRAVLEAALAALALGPSAGKPVARVTIEETGPVCKYFTEIEGRLEPLALGTYDLYLATPPATPVQPTASVEAAPPVTDAMLQAARDTLPGGFSDLCDADLEDIWEAMHRAALAPSPSAGLPAHASDCAVHNAPAYPPGPCDCGAIGSPPSEVLTPPRATGTAARKGAGSEGGEATPPAPVQTASVEAVDREFTALRVAYKRGVAWRAENPDANSALVEKAAYDYADKATASLTPAPTQGDGA